MNSDKKSNSTQAKAEMQGCILLICLLFTTILAMVAGSLIATGQKNPIENLMLGIRDGFTGANEEDAFPEDEDDCSTDEMDTWLDEDVTSNTLAATDSQNTTSPEETEGRDSAETSAALPSDTSDIETSDISSVSDETDIPGTTTKPTTTKPVETTPAVTDSPITDEDRVKDPNYFHDVLFIGDSRTVGLATYGKIEGATYFARTSMNVKNAFQDKRSETEKSGLNLTEFLKEYQFGKIYILLGINEIGYSYSWILNHYATLLQTVQDLQPNAIIIIQSNMHVTQKKSDANPKTFNNSRINELNKRLAALADHNKIFYVDFNEVFDDKNGTLNPDYTGDGVHLRAKYYKLWRDWLLEKGKR